MLIRNPFLIPVVCLLYLMSSAGSATESIELEKFASIDVSKTLISKEENEYLITVSNTGEIELKDVVVIDTLPSGMKHVDSKYNTSSDPFPSICLNIGKEDSTKSITWELGSLDTNQSKEIYVWLSNATSDGTNPIPMVYAEGWALNNLINSSKAYDVEIDVSIDVFEVSNNTSTKFSKDGSLECAKSELYKITVANFGNAPLENIVLMATLAKGMKFENSSYLDKQLGKLDVSVYPMKFDEANETFLTWILGSLAPHKEKSVIMAAYLKPEVDNTSLKATAKGKASGIGVTDSQKSVNILPGCAWFVIENGTYVPCQEETAEFNRCCKRICPEWVNLSLLSN